MSVHFAHQRVSSLLILSNALPKNTFVCRPCLRKLSRIAAAPTACSASRARREIATSTNAISSPFAPNQSHAQEGFRKNYFLANHFWDRTSKDDRKDALNQVPLPGDTPVEAHNETTAVRNEAILPHRRRRRASTTADARDEEARSGVHELPLDASSQLSTISSTMPMNSFRQRFFTYLSLSKPRLGFLIVLTTATAYSLFPVAVSPLSSSVSLSPLTLLNLTTGTALSVASANALNMLLEPEHDAKMTRTRTRPLVRGLITPRAALVFAIITGAAGVGLLYTGVNPTVSFLSALNIFLYAGVYTPLKRMSVINTWAGAVVGGIPPLMGWAAAAGQQTEAGGGGWRELLFDPATSPGGWLLAALLFAWQFPHFNALSYPIRHEYAAAGYKMLVSVNVRKTALIALRYALLMFPICAGLSFVGVTGWAFVGTSGAVNAWMLREAWRFYRLEGAKGSARGLFWASVWHLPLVLVLAMVHKKGLWERLVNGGLADDELYEYYYVDADADADAAAVGDEEQEKEKEKVKGRIRE